MEIRWITDIYCNSEHQNFLHEQLSALSAKPSFVDVYVYRTLVESKYILNFTLPDNMRQLIDMIRFNPLTITYDTVPSFKVERGLKTVITAMVAGILKLEVTHITRTIFQCNNGKIVSFTPYVQTNTGDYTPVLIQESKSGIFRKACNLENYKDLEVYSRDPIARYVLANLDYDLERVFQINNLTLGPVETDFETLKSEVAIKTAVYRSDFHFYTATNGCEFDYTWINPELAKMWQMETIHSEPTGQVYRSEFDPGMDLETWFQESTLSIWGDKLPTVEVPAYDLSDDFQERNITNKLIAKAKATRAYKQLVNYNPNLANHIFDITVSDNNLISVPITSKNDRKIFVSSLRAEFGTSITWNVKVVNSFQEGILTRYLLQNLGSESFLFRDNNIEYVVYTVSKPGIGVLDFSLDLYQQAAIDLKSDVLTRMAHCANFDQISELTLLELLNLTEVVDDSESLAYCFLAEDLRNLNIPVNPETRIPLSRYIINKANYIMYGIRGYFNVGILSGLYVTYPQRVSMDVVIGDIETEVVDTYITVFLRRPIKGADKFKVRQRLFDIILSSDQEPVLKQAINNLWRAGYLMSDWGRSLYDQTLELSAKPIQGWSILEQAADSMLDGQLALAFIQRAEHEI